MDKMVSIYLNPAKLSQTIGYSKIFNGGGNKECDDLSLKHMSYNVDSPTKNHLWSPIPNS